MSVAPREDRLGLAVILMAASFLLFALLDTVAKVLVLAGLPVLQVVFLRFTGHAFCVLGLFGPREGAGVFRSNAPRLQLLRALGLAGATAFNFAALQYLPLTVTISIFFASPLMVCLLAIPLLGERVGPRRLAGVFAGFLGVLVITEAWSADFQWAMLLSVASMLSASLYFVLTRKLAGVDGNAVSQLYASALPAIALAPFALAGWQVPAAGWQWLLLALTGVLGFTGHVILTVAYRYAEASRVSPMVYSQIIWATLLGWTVFGQAPSGTTLIGTAIIVASGLYIWTRERAVARAASGPPPGPPAL